MMVLRKGEGLRSLLVRKANRLLQMKRGRYGDRK